MPTEPAANALSERDTLNRQSVICHGRRNRMYQNLDNVTWLIKKKSQQKNEWHLLFHCEQLVKMLKARRRRGSNRHSEYPSKCELSHFVDRRCRCTCLRGTYLVYSRSANTHISRGERRVSKQSQPKVPTHMYIREAGVSDVASALINGIIATRCNWNE